jgi:hypothetical protein
MAMNTRILEAQLAEAVDDDLRRQNVNSAKLRASSQAVPYEQFKQFVGIVSWSHHRHSRAATGCARLRIYSHCSQLLF